MFSLENLCKFLVKAKKSTYTSEDNSKNIKENDGSTSLIFTEDNFKYHDNYFGGEPFGGREVVFFDNRPVYIMAYYGKVNNNVEDIQKIYSFLQKALKLITEDKPFRGPKEFKENNLEYINIFEGEIDNFSGEEIIKENGQEIYRAKYMGGLVNQRK
jgi:hypothetical protein